jgi:putative protease
MSDVRIGKVTHFFDHICVAVLELEKPVQVGDTVHFLGHSTDFEQEVTSLQIEHKPVEKAKPGQDIAMKVAQKVHPNDAVFKVTGKE